MVPVFVQNTYLRIGSQHQKIFVSHRNRKQQMRCDPKSGFHQVFDRTFPTCTDQSMTHKWDGETSLIAQRYAETNHRYHCNG